MEEVTVADQSAGEVDVLASALGDLGFSPKPAKADNSEASESDSDLSQDEEDKPETEDPAEDVSEAEDAEEQDEEDVPREKIQRRIDKLTAARKSAEEKATALAAEEIGRAHV